MKIHQIPKFTMRDFQVTILRDFLKKNFRGAVSVCRGGGKDFIGLACANALALTKPGSNILYFGVSLKSVKKILMSNNDKTGIPVYKDVLDLDALQRTTYGEYFFKEMSCFRYKNGSIIYIVGTDQDQELGTSIDAVICTEAARFAFNKWIFIRGNVQRAEGRILLISTPYFASEFNDLLDGVHRESGLWKIYHYNALQIHNADGSRVYSDKRLAEIRKEYDEATFNQEFLCSTRAITNTSILGASLEKAWRPKPSFNGERKQMIFCFDLGNTDRTVMYTAYKDDNLKSFVLINQEIASQTPLQDFILKAVRLSKAYDCFRSVTIVLPFDSDQTYQGWNGKLNRKKELERFIEDNKLEWNIAINSQLDVIRMLQVSRQVIETQRLGIIGNADGDDIVLGLSSVQYKKDGKTGKILMEIDKRSGKYEDHVLAALRYLVAFLFRDLYDSTDVCSKPMAISGYGRLAQFNPELQTMTNNFNKVGNGAMIGGMRNNFTVFK